MSLIRKKRKLRKVIVHFGDKEGKRFVKEIVVPDGYSFKVGYASHPCLFNQGGQPVYTYNWRGGYEIIYEYIYD